MAGGKDFHPEEILFELHKGEFVEYPTGDLTFEKKDILWSVSRISDCLYSAYGTKWNGNAAAYNGSLFAVQDEKIRRLSPLECERLLASRTSILILKAQNETNRYQAIGNSVGRSSGAMIGKRFSFTWINREHL